MPFDFPQSETCLSDRQRTGLANHHSGLAAEDAVAARYVGEGHAERARRWRGPAGEIDLIFEDAEGLVFVEVKSGPTHARAAERLTLRQIARIALSAECYAAETGRLRPVRIDAALVDDLGRIDILRNVTMH